MTAGAGRRWPALAPRRVRTYNGKLVKKVRVPHRVVPFALALALMALAPGRRFLLDSLAPAPPRAAAITCGASFSARYAARLGLDPRAALTDVVRDLGIKALRIPVYWDEVEPEPGGFRWDGIDWEMEEAARDGARVVLVVGHKVPRFPEYHAPAWAARLRDDAFGASLLRFVAEAVRRFRDHAALEAWQVENEPLAAFAGWRFGEHCRDVTRHLREEIGLVRALDRGHPVVVSYAATPWIASQLPRTLGYDSDVVAVSVYRRLYFRSTFYTGYLDLDRLGLLAPPSLRCQKRLASRHGRGLWVGELQAEPWPASTDGLLATSPADLSLTMGAAQLAALWKDAADAGIDRIYLWGVEWILRQRKLGLDQDVLELTRELAAGGGAPRL